LPRVTTRMASGNEEEEDDYLSMGFGDAAPPKETSLQRTARLKKEAAERGRVPSKKELAEKAKEARDVALATQLDSSNKGAKMMAKMGFKGGALGKSENARTQPIELLMKDDRGGIGMDSEKKRKIREAVEEREGMCTVSSNPEGRETRLLQRSLCSCAATPTIKGVYCAVAARRTCSACCPRHLLTLPSIDFRSTETQEDR